LNNPLIADFLFVKLDIYDNLQHIKRIPRFQVSLETSDGIEVLSRRTCKAENFELSSDKKNLYLKKVFILLGFSTVRCIVCSLIFSPRLTGIKRVVKGKVAKV